MWVPGFCVQKKKKETSASESNRSRLYKMLGTNLQLISL